MAQDLDFVDAWGVEQECALHADAVRSDPAHGEASPRRLLAVDANHNALENLYAFAVALHDARVDAHSITYSELRNLRMRFGCQRFKQWMLHFSYLPVIFFSARAQFLHRVWPVTLFFG